MDTAATKKMTGKEIIRRELRMALRLTQERGYYLWLAIHEMDRHYERLDDYSGIVCSENGLATRASEMQKAGEVESRKREGTNYSEWRLREGA